jgi:hypothetical protein
MAQTVTSLFGGHIFDSASEGGSFKLPAMRDAPCTDPDDDVDACDSDATLTHCAMFSEDTGWHAALTMPLPDAPDIALLDHARRWVLLYLDWVTGDLALRAPPRELARAIKLGADRLREIALAMPAASAGDRNELAEDMSGEQPFAPVMRLPPPDNFFRGPLI